MKLVLDFQACQSGSKFRGIGRGTRSLLLAMANQFTKKGHEVVCLLNEAFHDGLEELRLDIVKNAPSVYIKSFKILSNSAAAVQDNIWRQMASRLLREHAIASMQPDFVHVPALLADGWGDDSVGSIGEMGIYIPTSITQHDLIPLAMRDIYMPEGRFSDYYLKKLEGAKRADLFLAISDFSGKEAINLLGVSPNKVINISSAVDSIFFTANFTDLQIENTLSQYGIKSGFLFYVPGGFDPRKNLERLIYAYASLTEEIRAKHPLVIGSKLDHGRRELLESTAEKAGIQKSEFILTDYVSDNDLMCLYRACYAYVFPSLHEGFGLPVLEAMACGAPVIASNTTSIPEVVGMDEALFNPYSVDSIANKIQQIVSGSNFRQRLKEHALKQPEKFSWDRSAEIAVKAIEEYHLQKTKEGWQPFPRKNLPTSNELLAMLNNSVKEISPSAEDLANFQLCYTDNLEALSI